MPWRLENHDPARSCNPLHGQPRSFPAPGDRCSHSLSRLPCQGGRPAVHWCGTTIGTSFRFCLQSNPAIKRGTKSPLITPCHKVICPEGNPSQETRRVGGGVAEEERGTVPTTFQSKWLEYAEHPSRPGKHRGQPQCWRRGVTREPSLELRGPERGIALLALCDPPIFSCHCNVSFLVVQRCSYPPPTPNKCAEGGARSEFLETQFPFEPARHCRAQRTVFRSS